MKNSRRSDRELGRVLGVSQPTVSRLIKKLEKEGTIREYTMIPDFRRLGYEIMGITSLAVQEGLSREKLHEVRKTSTELDKSNPHAALMAVNGMNHGKNRLFISFYEDYSDYLNAMKLAKQIPFANVDSLESFLVNLEDETSYRLLSMSAIAQHLLTKIQEKKE
jgi:DNA-binding Lrp family transcriptional regulator